MPFNPQDIVFIVNPHSGKRQPRRVIKKIQSMHPDYRIFLSEDVSAYHRFMEENLEKYRIFVVAGGDGTINLCASYLFGRDDKILAIIPVGSGNGFARETGFLGSLEDLEAAIERGEYFKSDGMEIHGRRFINVAGVGFDGCVAHAFAKKKGRGILNYGISALECMASFKPIRVKLSLGNQEIEGEYEMVTMANTRQFGNNAFIAPQANPENRRLDLVLVKTLPFYYYPVFIINMFTGNIRQSKYVDYILLEDEFTIETDYNLYHVDGEPVTFPASCKVKIHKSVINILKMKQT